MTDPEAHLIDGLRPWRHDLVGCLWTSAGSLLDHHGAPVLETLGAAWGFRHLPADLRREEYYYPTDPGTSLWEALAPYHPVRSRWHEPVDAEAGWAEVRAEVLAGRPTIVAADNFDLPFRPAYQDVHTNHLVIVHGFDQRAGTVRVLDAVPPRFHGDIKLAELAAARGSHNPELHDRDLFFTNRPIANRWLEVEIDTTDFPPFDVDTVRRTIDANLERFAAPPPGDGFAGLAGQRAYLADAVERLAAGQPLADEIFLVAGAVLAHTALHADWLALAGRTLGRPQLTEVGRSVERVAHHWTAVRIAGALTRDGSVGPDRLARRFAALHADHARVLEHLADVRDTL
ncbi:BtrH N-terminal domain-containing protein [Streptomyces sp. HSW2009]|uniref:BtrH N-terminal domain-containing protein n=1 Tax=Streptomyces sp. HSW2009 TaxID=3142890 RepID=UPI0032EBF02B